MATKRKQEPIEYITLCEGVTLSPSFFEKKENRLLTLLLKGFIVYLLSMGSIGFYLSAIGVKEYNEVLCHLVIGGMAILCAFLYYRLFVENTGYLILFALFGLAVYQFRIYINSGFYALVNITTDRASQYFNVDIQRLYTEQIENRYVTITFVCLFIGVVLDVLLNVYISRRMQYVNSIFFIMGLNLIPLYLTEEPDMRYVIMMLAGGVMAYIFKSSKHYSPQVNVKRDDRVFAHKGRKKKKKREISYVYDIKALVQAGISGTIFTICVVLAVSAFKPKDSFNVGYQGNKYKELTMAAVSTLLMDGWDGLYRDREDVGGIHGGKLGDVSTVRLDYETDLVVQMTPYTYDRIFLKSFTGIEYVPYANRWTSMADLTLYDASATPEADALKDYYEGKGKGSSKGVMTINPIGVNDFYYPYYTENTQIEGVTYTVEFYPRLDENESVIVLSDYGGEPYTELDLYVPPENEKAIKELCKSIEWSSSDEGKVYDLQAYFQENIPYTIRPGKTPKNEDFVNYFLMDNRKGYCTHYASTAVLVFRYMGIPARYVEGYAVDYNQFEDAELVEGTKYEDYYKGYSEVGETALLQLNVTDADAHAWVEIYITGKGWIPVEVTPAGETEEVVDFWEMFDEVMGDQETEGGDIGGGNIVNFKVPNKLIKSVCYTVAGIVVALLLMLLALKGVKVLKVYVRYAKAGINDKLILKYSIYCKKMGKKDKAFKEKINYDEQIEYLATKYGCQGEQKIIAILEKAGFSNIAIDEADYEMVMEWLPSYSKISS